MGAEGMPKGMWMDIRRKALCHGNLLDDSTNAAAGERASTLVDEQPARYFFGFQQDFLPCGPVGSQRLFGRAFQRDIALLLPFAANQNHAVSFFNIVQFDPDQLRVTQATTIKKFEDGAIAFWERRRF